MTKKENEMSNSDANKCPIDSEALNWAFGQMVKARAQEEIKQILVALLTNADELAAAATRLRTDLQKAMHDREALDSLYKTLTVNVIEITRLRAHIKDNHAQLGDWIEKTRPKGE